MGAIKVHHTATSEGAWDGPGNEARLRTDGSESYYRSAFAWQDPDGVPETKAAYRFIHHEVSGDGDVGAANVRACQTGIGVLNGARGGTTIPSGDRQGVYRHLAAHLEDAEVEPPDLRSRGLPAADSIERRYVSYELRVADEEDGPHVRGYGAVFNTLSEDLCGFREIIEPGAFTKTLQEADVRSLWNHNALYVLGRTGSGTLTLRQDEKGLHYDVTPPDAQWALDLMKSIRRGDVDQASFGFETVRDRWSQDDDGRVTRRLLEVRLFDVGPVTFPAYPQTSAEARSKVEEMAPQPGDNDGEDTGAPGQGPHPPGDDAAQARARLDVMRRRVDLAEAE